MHTPFFPAWRSRLAALGRRTARAVRPAILAQLQEHLRDFLPAPLLSAEDDGPNSRERIYSLRLTCECFLWQVLKPHTACREVVRQVQALFRSHGRDLIDEGDSLHKKPDGREHADEPSHRYPSLPQSGSVQYLDRRHRYALV